MPIPPPKRVTDVQPEKLQEFFKFLVGKSRDEAVQLIILEGFRPRVLSVDGSPIPYHSKFEDTRINVDIIHGTVTRAYPG